ncbi:MAG: ABC transporter substrate-binding protein [Chloroflexota bacterium]|nr:ABC transporter substrate-binding protein [Chloroflexota bacterium]
MTQYIRLQAFIAFSGIVLLLTMLSYLSTTLETVLLPEPGGTYTEALVGYPASLNPLYLQNRAEQDIAALLFNGLTRADERGLLQPDLAESWQVSEDGKHYTFHLRNDIQWHDGAPFTAKDVAYTVRVLRHPAYTHDSVASEMWRTVSVEIEDPYTIRFTLPDELAPFAPFLSFTTFAVLPSHLLDGVPTEELLGAPFSRHPVGTGPWRVTHVAPEQIVLEPHPAYQGEKPMLDELVFRFYDDARAALEAYQHEEVMGVAQISPRDLGRVLRDPTLNPHPTTIASYTALFFNLQHSRFQKHELREALMRGLDRKELIEEVLAGQGIVADGFLLPTHWAYNSELPRYSYKPDKAGELLKQAGWFDSDDDDILDQGGLPLQFTIMVDEGDHQLRAMATAVAAQWKKFGINVEPRTVSSGELAAALRSRDFDVVLLSTPQGGLPADPDFYPLWHSSQATEAGKNYTSFSSEQADSLLVAARHSLDFDTRRALYHDFQSILARELPALPLYHPIYNYAVSDRVKEVQIGPLAKAADRFQSLPQWYIRTKRLLIDLAKATQEVADQ